MLILTLGCAAVYSSASVCHRLRPGSLFWMCYQSISTAAAACADALARPRMARGRRRARRVALDAGHAGAGAETWRWPPARRSVLGGTTLSVPPATFVSGSRWVGGDAARPATVEVPPLGVGSPCRGGQPGGHATERRSRWYRGLCPGIELLHLARKLRDRGARVSIWPLDGRDLEVVNWFNGDFVSTCRANQRNFRHLARHTFAP